MAERRPRPSDFDTEGRYYTALLIWLDYRYDDQVDRARKFHKITHKEDKMPVKRETKPKVKTPLQVAADRDLDDMFERADRLPGGIVERRARIVELIELDRDLNEDEQVEFDAFIARRDRDRQRARRLAIAVDRRQAKHPDEDRGESALAVVLKQSEKRRRREERRDQREAAARLVREQERAEAAQAASGQEERAPQEPAPAPIEATILPEAAPRRRRPRYGIVMQTDQYGNRVG